MITGYNTDVRHAEVAFHVQTEDKGTSNPLIESLVYVGGQVVTARRSSYSDLLADGKGEAEVVRLMERQHRTMIAAIKAGRFNQKVLDQLGHRAPAALVAAVESGAEEAAAPTADEAAARAADEEAGDATHAGGEGITAPRPAAAGGEPTLDQVILEYLTHEASQEQLLLTLHDGTEVALGAPATLALRTSSSRDGVAVSGAEVTVRMISTVDEPRALARGVTDDEGGLTLDFEVPALDRGTAALIITASSPIGRAEIKQLL
jgi:hypothetical protein